MDIQIGSKVECTDGQGGHVARVVMDPATGRLTHLVVRLGWLAPRDVVVPMDRVAAIGEREVRLAITKAELERMPGFLEKHFVSPELDWTPPPSYPRQTVLWLTTPADFEGSEVNLFGRGPAEYRPLFVEETENVPEGSIVIRREMPVWATDGPVGEVLEVVTTPATIRAEYLVVRGGAPREARKQVAVDEVDSVDEDRVNLRISRAEFTGLPDHPAHG